MNSQHRISEYLIRYRRWLIAQSQNNPMVEEPDTRSYTPAFTTQELFVIQNQQERIKKEMAQ